MAKLDYTTYELIVEVSTPHGTYVDQIDVRAASPEAAILEAVAGCVGPGEELAEVGFVVAYQAA